MYLKTTAINLSLLAANIGFFPTLYAASTNILRGSSTKTHKDCTLLIKVSKFEDDSEHQEVECETENGTILPFEDMPDIVVKAFKEGSIVSNVDILRFSETTSSVEVQNGELSVSSTQEAIIIKGDEGVLDDRRNRMLQGGNPLKTLALWVQAADASTSTPMDNGDSNCLTDQIFGTYGDVNNLRTKYSQCSYDVTTFEAFTGTTSTGATVSNGVYPVTVSESAGGVENSIIRNAATSAATTALGSLSQFDHVMVCVPPGTSGGWIGYAYVNSRLSVYNDVWCNYLSIQMHELGHNLGLGHSGETATYDDQSGMMGYSYSSDDGPNMCFNAAKSWQLGWYANKRLQLDSDNYNWSGKMYGIDDYGSSRSDDGVITIRLASSQTDDIYVSFNKQSGINSGTREGGNQVLIHRRPGTVSGYSASQLLAKLSAGGSYSASIDGGSVPITVNSLTTGTNGFADVQIGSALSDPPTNSPTQPQTNSPTKTPTQLPTQAPTDPPVTSPTNPPTNPPTKLPAQPPTDPPVIQPTAPPTKSPTKAPTSSPPTRSPVGQPTNSPTTKAPTTSPDPCQDKPDDAFYWEKRNKERSCQWLMDRKHKRKVCLEVNGGDGLPPAREVCNFTCQKWAKFQKGNGTKTCNWLKKKLVKRPNLCQKFPDAEVKCPDACGLCD